MAQRSARLAGCKNPVSCLAIALALLFESASSAALAQEQEEYAPGVWHYRSVACVDTTVRSVEPRLTTSGQKTFTARDFQESGVEVEFNTFLGSDPENRMRAAVVHYQDTPGNNVMSKERAGEKVQVCFLSRPAPTKFCDPDKDGRGRLFRVYDYRQRAQYSGMNSEHGCGGA